VARTPGSKASGAGAAAAAVAAGAGERHGAMAGSGGADLQRGN